MTSPIESCLPGCYKRCMIARAGVWAYVSDGGFPAGGPVPDYFYQAGRCRSVVGQPWAGVAGAARLTRSHKGGGYFRSPVLGYLK